MVEITKLCKTVKGRSILRDIDLRIASGECVGLIGPNGAGKTTLIKCMTGITEYTGSITFDDDPMGTKKQEIGYLSQYTDFKGWMTCEESLYFFGELSGMRKDELKKKISEVLAEVGLTEARKLKVEQLSGGMRQRLGIAQAILHDPKLLILDEPVSALDPIGRSDVKKLLTAIKKRTTVLISTHILEDAKDLCDRFVVIKSGEIVGEIDGTVAEVRRDRLVVTVGNSYREADVLEIFRDWGSVRDVSFISRTRFVVNGAVDLALGDVLGKMDAYLIDVVAVSYEEKGIEETFLDMVTAI